MTAEYDEVAAEENRRRRVREYGEGSGKEGGGQRSQIKTNDDQRYQMREEDNLSYYQLREREDQRAKEEATKRLYEVAHAGEEEKIVKKKKPEKKKKKIIGTRFFDPKERRVVDTRRTFVEDSSSEELDDYFQETEETEKPTTGAPRPKQRRKQRPKPTEKIFYEEEKIGAEKKNLRFEIPADEKKKAGVAESEEWGSKMWSEIKADQKFAWGEKPGVGDKLFSVFVSLFVLGWGVKGALFCVFYILTFCKLVFVLVHFSTAKASVAAERRRKMGLRRKKAQEQVTI